MIHGGGSTIGTNFGALIPHFTPSRQVIAVELQGHGHTPAVDRPDTYENSADDVAALLHDLDLRSFDVLGFSNGGNVAMRLAMQHPSLVRRQIVASAPYRRSGMADGFFDGLAGATPDQMPGVYREAFSAIDPDPRHLQEMFGPTSRSCWRGSPTGPTTNWPA
jgi:pimeloyl-ACP methyl ester carboxylesterase